ncbi:uncharacterized protein LOC130975203 [Arachis stenosperma]|uniref:uncharacterized protein LOC130975203 n=1 Tax=Arachis stenosperma TaxID=217475 RepID=UPI0025AB9856|nr:uncharacterized protein LOC130975203 [Arachis stenosperma]
MKRLESQVGYLSQQFPKPTDSFPSDTEKNPRGETKKVRWEDCKMITISDKRSVEEVHTQTEYFQDNPKEKYEGRNQAPHPTHMEELKKGETLNPHAPFPQRLKAGVARRMYSRFLDMFASLDVNLPFIKALQQMPSFIKYIKELLAKKSSLKGGQTIKMNRECSALIQIEPPTKKKDLGSFHFPCAIGKTMIDKGLWHDEQLTFNVFKPSQEANYDNKESKEEHNKELMEETSTVAQAPHLRTPMVDKQCGQKE